jgi:hypothetical protein
MALSAEYETARRGETADKAMEPAALKAVGS